MRFQVHATLALLVAAAPAGAAEFIPAWSVDGVWDSNVFRENLGKEEADESVRTGPDFTLRDRKGDLTYDLHTQARYEAYRRFDTLDTNSLSDLNFFVDGTGGWQATDLTKLSVSENFIRTNSVTALLNQNVSPSQISTFTPGRTELTTNDASASLSHRLGPLWELTATGEQVFYDYSDPLQSDTHQITGTTQLTRAMTRRLLMGFGGQVDRQIFESIDGSDSSGTTFYQGFAITEYEISRTMRLSVNAGPAWSLPDDPGNNRSVIDYHPVQVSSCPMRGGVFVFDPTNRTFDPITGQPLGGCTNRAVYRNNALGLAVPITPSTQGLRGNAPAQNFTDVTFTGQGPEGTLSYFGRIDLTKDWHNWSADVALSRHASNSSGLGGATILTALDASLHWNPTQLWHLSLDGTYTIQSSANELRSQLVVLEPNTSIVPPQLLSTVTGQPCAVASSTCALFTPDPVGVPVEVRSGNTVTNDFKLKTWRLEFHGERQINRKLSLHGSASYFRQSSESDITQKRVAQIVRVIFGVTWTFDPIIL